MKRKGPGAQKMWHTNQLNTWERESCSDNKDYGYCANFSQPLQHIRVSDAKKTHQMTSVKNTDICILCLTESSSIQAAQMYQQCSSVEQMEVIPVPTAPLLSFSI